jgi:hypothetical protein
MVQRVLRLLHAVLDVHHVGVVTVATQVVPEPFVKGITVLRDHRLDGVELLNPPFHRLGGTRKEVGPLARYELCVIRFAHLVTPLLCSSLWYFPREATFYRAGGARPRLLGFGAEGAALAPKKEAGA